MQPVLAVVGAVVVLVAFLVSIGLHEAGHFWIARWVGMKPTTFSIGMGPTIWRRQAGGGETEVSLKLLPIGGSVQIPGMLPPPEGSQPERGRWQIMKWKAQQAAQSFFIGYAG